MSTRSVIARPIAGAELRFAGRYCHSDGYPSGVGKTLFEAVNGYFNGDIGAMLTLLLDDHPAGWSSLMNADFSLKPGFTSYDVPKKYKKPDGSTNWATYFQSPQWRRPRCYCHGQRHHGGELRTEANTLDTDIEYAYLVHEPARILTILVPDIETFTELATIAFDGDSPDWDALDRKGREIQEYHWSRRSAA
jgi:hypothetical protein